MYGCYNGFLVYGFKENQENFLLDPEWLEEHYPGMNSYATDIIRNYAGGNMIYGIICKVDRETGRPLIGQSMKELVKKLHDHFLKSKNVTSENVPVGYYIAVSGDYEIEHSLYMLD